VSPSQVVSTVDRVTGAVVSHVVSTERQTVEGVESTVSPAPTARPASPLAPRKRLVRHKRRNHATQASAAPKQDARLSQDTAAERQAAASPSVRVVPELSPLRPPAGFLGGASAAGSFGLALVFVALASALSALSALGLGRRLFPSLAEGHGFTLICDLERPD
jgi:hypothetical protein